MEKLYYESAYRKEFEGTVLSCEPGKNGFEIVLDQTAFYPEGGGQPADTGILGGIRVLDVHEKNGRIVHMTKEPLTPGETVWGKIDWDRRFLHMQEHSGEHLVSGLIHGRFGYDNVGFHMGAEEVTIDFNGLLEWKDLMEIEAEANRLIWENEEVYAGFPPKEELADLDYRSKKEIAGDVRITEFPGADICACCGTHVKNSAEVGLVKFISLQHIGRRRSYAGTGGNHIRAYQRGRRAQSVSKGFWRNGRFLQRRLKDAFIGGGNPQFRSGNNSIPEPMRGID